MGTNVRQANLCNLPQDFPSKFPGGLTALMSVYWKCDAPLLARALESIFHNTIRPDEILVVIDGPIQIETQKVISLFQEKYSELKTLPLDKNQGLAIALNEGLAQTKTKWLARCDQDDINYLDRFEKQLACLQKNPHAVLIGSHIAEINNEGEILSQRRVPESTQAIKKLIPFRNPFNHMTVIYDVNFIRNLGGYPNIAYQDYGLWIKVIGSGGMAVNIQEPLVYATTGDDMFRRRGGIKIALDEFKLHHLMAQYQFRSWFGAIIWACTRSAVSLMPAQAKRLLYRQYLRS
jgi:glycosyltransferase involved in cell wall biosynthesis